MKWIIAVLLVLIAYLQFRLWVGEGSMAEVVSLEQQIKNQHQEIDELKERNRVLALQVDELKSGVKTIEERARTELGMIREGETFYIVDDDAATATNKKDPAKK